MSETAEAPPTTKRVELAKDRWVELRTARLVSDVRYQREQRAARGNYDDDVLDELSLIEARVVAWSFGEKVPADMALRRTVLDALEEEDALKLIMANKGVEERPKGSPARSGTSSTGTSRSRRKAKTQKISTDVVGSALTNG